MYHTAILYPTKKELAAIVSRLQELNYPLTGAADHGVSLAIYLNDPDCNGVELYWDKPRQNGLLMLPEICKWYPTRWIGKI